MKNKGPETMLAHGTKAHFRSNSSLGTAMITTEPPSSFLLHKLRITDRSLSRKSRDRLSRDNSQERDREDVYGRGVLKDEFIAHSERLKVCSSSSRLLRIPSTHSKATFCHLTTSRPSSHRRFPTASSVRLTRCQEIIQSCNSFAIAGRVEAMGQVRKTKSGGSAVLSCLRRPAGFLETRMNEASDPSSLVPRYERNLQIHQKRSIARSRSFLRRKL